MALIKTLDDLANFVEYRKFIIAAFKSAKDESEFFVSKDDFDFEVKGKPWSGRVLLFGSKGATTMSALKREGMQFRSGTCIEKDGDLHVTGISGALLKLVDKTLKKLPVGWKTVAGKESADAADERKKEEAQKKKDEAAANSAEKKDAAAAKKLQAKVKSTKSGLRADLAAVVKDKPANQAKIAKLVKQSGEQEKAGEWQAALDSLRELEAEIAIAQGAADDTDEDDSGALAQTAAKQKAEILKRAKKALADDPSQRDPIGTILKEADKHEKKKDYDAQLDEYTKLEDLLDAISPDDGDEEVELTSIDDWLAYRKWVRVRFKRIPKEAKAAEPFYVSRKKMAFDMGGRKWKGHAVLGGKKAKILAKELKKNGMMLLTGACYREGKQIFVSNMAGAALKAAGKTLKLLKLGYTLTPMSATAAATADAAVGEGVDDAAATDQDPKAAAFAKRREALEPALQSVLSQGLGDPSRIRATDAFAQESAANGDWQKAAAGLVRLEKLVEEAKASGSSETDVIAPGLVEYRKSLLFFAQAKSSANGQLASLRSNIDAIPDQEDLARAVSDKLGQMFDDIANVVDDAMNKSKDDAEPVNASVRAEVKRAINLLETDPLLSHIDDSPWGISVKKPLLTALAGIQNAMPA